MDSFCERTRLAKRKTALNRFVHRTKSQLTVFSCGKKSEKELKIAVIGAGVYCRDTYLPLLKKTFKNRVELRALWSLTKDLAEATLSSSPFAGDVRIAIKEGERGLEEILTDPKIDGVLIVVPAFAGLEIARRCWRAGKHVMQEKPVAKSVELALRHLKEYRTVQTSLWYVAENYRFEKSFLNAVKFKSEVGRVLKVDLVANKPTNEQNKFYASPWRRSPEKNPGGFVYDCSVHFVAAMRLIGHDFGLGEIETVSGKALSLVPENLPPMDTAVAVFTYASGIPGSFSVSFGAKQAYVSLSVVGTEGTLKIKRRAPRGYTTKLMRAGKTVQSLTEPFFSGMEGEISQFFDSIKYTKTKGELDRMAEARRASPEEAIRDLAVIEALFASSEADCQPVIVDSITDPSTVTPA